MTTPLYSSLSINFVSLNQNINFVSLSIIFVSLSINFVSAVDLDKLQQPQQNLAVVVVSAVCLAVVEEEEVYLGWVLSPVRRKPSRMCLVPRKPLVLLLLSVTVSCDLMEMHVYSKSNYLLL